MTNIICDRIVCTWNINNTCTNKEIQIGMDLACVNYERKIDI